MRYYITFHKDGTSILGWDEEGLDLHTGLGLKPRLAWGPQFGNHFGVLSGFQGLKQGSPLEWNDVNGNDNLAATFLNRHMVPIKSSETPCSENFPPQSPQACS